MADWSPRWLDDLDDLLRVAPVDKYPVRLVAML